MISLEFKMGSLKDTKFPASLHLQFLSKNFHPSVIASGQSSLPTGPLKPPLEVEIFASEPIIQVAFVVSYQMALEPNRLFFFHVGYPL